MSELAMSTLSYKQSYYKKCWDYRNIIYSVQNENEDYSNFTPKREQL